MLPGFDGLRFSHWQAAQRDDGVVVAEDGVLTA